MDRRVRGLGTGSEARSYHTVGFRYKTLHEERTEVTGRQRSLYTRMGQNSDRVWILPPQAARDPRSEPGQIRRARSGSRAMVQIELPDHPCLWRGEAGSRPLWPPVANR